ncbi:molybdopterin synthase sulfur carrier subunit [Pseudoalteromonas sp. S3785]|uniref:MoaD/ThiS family protein n=1 Tax=Pseudoalteromonas sp. S3785 TaxID=579545 RepID=UPI00110BE8BE|nr:MoaD/ThiS family protein [Pseudoalteromonas sp. S3785]TMO72628.1 molybdopterin synthase sulfur carrier subunit [Pseudoalteromonas sp. S3785]
MAVGSETNLDNTNAAAGQVKVLFFGQLKERLKCDKLTVEIAHPLSIKAFKHMLVEQNPLWQAWLEERDVLCALNQTMSSSDELVKAGDELAFFPPVTGG